MLATMNKQSCAIATNEVMSGVFYILLTQVSILFWYFLLMMSITNSHIYLLTLDDLLALEMSVA